MKKITLICLALFMGVTVMAQAPKHHCLLKGKVKTIVENDHIFYSFNEAGAVTKVEIMEDGKRKTAIACEYNDKGQLVKRTGAVAHTENQLIELYEDVPETFEETFTYANNRLVKSYNKLNWDVKYNYTTQQNDKVKLNGKTTQYTYNPKGQLIKKASTLANGTKDQAVTYKYNVKGQLIAERGENFTYNAQNLLSSIEGDEYAYTYKYNTQKNVIQQNESGIDEAITKYTYTYDAQNNWVSRVASAFESMFDIPDKTTTREITYY